MSATFCQFIISCLANPSAVFIVASYQFDSICFISTNVFQQQVLDHKISQMKNQNELDVESQQLTESKQFSDPIIKIEQEEIQIVNDDQQDELQSHIREAYPKKTLDIWLLIKLAPIAAVTVFVIVFIGMSGASTAVIVEPIPTMDYLSQFARKSYMQMSLNQPNQYIDVDKAKPFKQLPFCIVIKPELTGEQKNLIIASIKAQNYSNYIILDEQKKGSSFSYTFTVLSSKINGQCSEYAILLFVDQPLSMSSLNVTCQYFQVFNMWMAYSIYQQPGRRGFFVEISSMYVRLFQLLQSNDFYGQHQAIKSQNVGDEIFNQNVLTSLFQLCRFNAKNVSDQSLYDLQVGRLRNPQSVFLSTFIPIEPKKDDLQVKRIPFQPLLSLDQDYKVDIEQLLNRRLQFYNSNVTLLQPDLLKRIDHQVTHKQFQQLLEFQQIIYIPPEHSLNTIDKMRMTQKYGPEKYQKQLPLCVCIFSHNNEQNNRQKKIIRSIVRQNYNNFHIVFVDDKSNDHTLSETMNELDRLKFPKERVTIVQNLNHKYATYNYVNTAFSFCKDNDIQIILDGDDQLIGQNVFQFVNAKYQDDPTLWLMHTFYKTNRYGQGFNLLPFTNDFVFNIFGGRRFMYFISPLRTWSVKLIRSLPLRQHLSPLTGEWYDTACDVALQYGLFQMAGGEAHSRYFPEINYLYFTGYGQNDDSTMHKNLRRNIIHFLMTLRTPLQPLSSLQQKWRNRQIEQMLQKDRGVEYAVVQFKDQKKRIY